MNRKILLLAILGLLLMLAVVMLGNRNEKPVMPVLEFPVLSADAYDWIAAGIYQNEANGKARYLTHWNKGEDFPSLGIGHFIWFPAGVDAPFDEQFPAMFSYVEQQVPEALQPPPWLKELEPFAAPWTSREEFEQAWSTDELSDLRDWLESTQRYQAKFIVSEFIRRWQDLELPELQKLQLTSLIQQLLETPRGLFALIDYYNFKGLGNNPRERYQEQGWGLIQVLGEVLDTQKRRDSCADIVILFRDAAARRLSLRVELSPPGRKELRWLEGWLKRLDGYLESDQGEVETREVSGFRLTPYVQNPAQDAVTIIWFSHDAMKGSLSVWKKGSGETDDALQFETSPVLADSLAYHPEETRLTGACKQPLIPYQHGLRVLGLEAGTSYRYRVEQGSDTAAGVFTTAPGNNEDVRFIVYADSETEPESTGNHSLWPGDRTMSRLRRYPLDQTMGYAQNLEVIKSRQPAFVAIAGDLVQSGGEQRDWDEFWLHNASLAASSYIMPGLGNHEYFAGPGMFGKYETADSESAVDKYRTYFDLPGNERAPTAQQERYYALEYGVVSLIVLDTTDGHPHRSEMDSNWRLNGENNDGFAPDWHEGSEQYNWLLNELARAQANSRFTFVMFHGAPYTSGVHGKKPGDKKGRDILSGLPMQALTPLFLQFGVDGVFNGHDEMYEHSIVPGEEVLPGGERVDHQVHFWDIGIGGDGLRGPAKGVVNPYQVFLAHRDAPEIYAGNGVLEDGGKHYGHLEVNVEQRNDGTWQARVDAVYVFPLLDRKGQPTGFERRLYDDSLILQSNNLE